jgi:hypothetical protein
VCASSKLFECTPSNSLPPPQIISRAGVCGRKAYLQRPLMSFLKVYLQSHSSITHPVHKFNSRWRGRARRKRLSNTAQQPPTSRMLAKRTRSPPPWVDPGPPFPLWLTLRGGCVSTRDMFGRRNKSVANNFNAVIINQNLCHGICSGYQYWEEKLAACKRTSGAWIVVLIKGS